MRISDWSSDVCSSDLRPGLVERMMERTALLAERHGPVTVIGWSLGGLYAREIAKRLPQAVEQVITLGSPFSGDLRANRAWRLYERVAGHRKIGRAHV